MLRVHIDFSAPAAYLAMRPTLALAARHGWAIDWSPCRAWRDEIPGGAPDKSVSDRHFQARAAAQKRQHLHYAAVQGAPMIWRETPGETDLALAALAFAGPRAERFVLAAFKAYWVDGRDLNELDTVVNLLSDAGHDATRFDPTASLAALSGELDAVFAQGVVDAPAFLLNGTVFIGREHLPLIEAILTGSS